MRRTECQARRGRYHGILRVGKLLVRWSNPHGCAFGGGCSLQPWLRHAARHTGTLRCRQTGSLVVVHGSRMRTPMNHFTWHSQNRAAALLCCSWGWCKCSRRAPGCTPSSHSCSPRWRSRHTFRTCSKARHEVMRRFSPCTSWHTHHHAPWQRCHCVPVLCREKCWSDRAAGQRQWHAAAGHAMVKAL